MSISTARTLRAMVIVGALISSTQVSAARPETPRNGEIFRAGSKVDVWDQTASSWVTPAQFWMSYVRSSNGKYWGRGSEYPPYRQVREHDTFLVEVEQGACLMYFFHSRWRRAQDVRRWDPQFNAILGCPFVFD